MPTSGECSEVVRLLLGVTRRLRGRYAVYLLSTALFGLAALVPPRILFYFAETLPGLTAQTFGAFAGRLALLGGAAALLLAGTAALNVLLEEWLRLRLEAELRLQVLDRLHRLPLEKFDGAARGDWLSSLSRDVAAAEQLIGHVAPELLRNLAIAVGTLGLLAWYLGPLAALPLAAALLVGGIGFALQSRLVPLYARMRALYAELVQVLVENLDGWRTVRSHGAARSERGRVEKKIEAFTREGMRAARRAAVNIGLNAGMGQTVFAAALLLLGAAVARGTVGAAQALVFPFYLGLFFSAVRGIAEGANAWRRFQAESARLAALLGETPSFAEESRATTIDGRTGLRLVARDLGVGFPDGRSLPAQLGLDIGVGQIHAIVGASGSGKTTLLETLAGLRRPLAGELGVSASADAGSVPEPLWGDGVAPTRYAAYVEQRPYLFEGTVRENLTLGRAGVDDQALWQALADVNLDADVAARGGLGMAVADRGGNLSEGQRYRLALARALLVGRPFLLVDEPFASLDETTAAGIAETLGRLAPTHGIAVVTHTAPRGFRPDATVRICGFFSNVPQTQRSQP